MSALASRFVRPHRRRIESASSWYCFGFRDVPIAGGRLPRLRQRLPQQDRLAANLSHQLDGSEVVRKASSVAAVEIPPESEADARLDGRRSSVIDKCEGQLKPAPLLLHQRQFAPQPIGIADKIHAQSRVPVRAQRPAQGRAQIVQLRFIHGEPIGPRSRGPGSIRPLEHDRHVLAQPTRQLGVAAGRQLLQRERPR